MARIFPASLTTKHPEERYRRDNIELCRPETHQTFSRQSVPLRKSFSDIEIKKAKFDISLGKQSEIFLLTSAGGGVIYFCQFGI